MIKAENQTRRKVKNLLFWLFNRLENNNQTDFFSNGESYFIDSLGKYLNRKNLHKVVFMDIGANVGDYTAILLDMANKFGLDPAVYSFEPSNKSFEALSERFQGNARVHAVNAAASDSKGQSIIHFDKEGSKLASMYPRNLSAYNISMKSTETIQTLRLDSVLKQEGINHIDLMKLDVEGHELSVLDGMGEFLRSDFVDFIQFEYGGANLDSNTSLMDIYSRLEKAGFIIAKIMPNGLVVRSYSPSMDNFQYSNYVAISSQIIDDLK